jgi:hypothetical protein
MTAKAKISPPMAIRPRDSVRRRRVAGVGGEDGHEREQQRLEDRQPAILTVRFLIGLGVRLLAGVLLVLGHLLADLGRRQSLGHRGDGRHGVTLAHLPKMA